MDRKEAGKLYLRNKEFITDIINIYNDITDNRDTYSDDYILDKINDIKKISKKVNLSVFRDYLLHFDDKDMISHYTSINSDLMAKFNNILREVDTLKLKYQTNEKMEIYRKDLPLALKNIMGVYFHTGMQPTVANAKAHAIVDYLLGNPYTFIKYEPYVKKIMAGTISENTFKIFYQLVTPHINESINESYVSQRELEQLVTDIFDEVCENSQHIIKKRNRFFLVDFNLRNLDESKYKELRDFITKGNVTIYFEPYKGGENAKQRKNEVYIYYNADKLDVGVKSLDGNINCETLHGLMDDSSNYVNTTSYYISLLHELQHAYDYFRSKGKFKANKKAYDYYSKEDHDDTNANAKEYLQLPHEINARFTQTVHGLKFIDDNNEMIDLRDVIDEFRNKFNGWKVMSMNDKKHMIRKISQFWHRIQDAIQNES